MSVSSFISSELSIDIWLNLNFKILLPQNKFLQEIGRLKLEQERSADAERNRISEIEVHINKRVLGFILILSPPNPPKQIHISQ